MLEAGDRAELVRLGKERPVRRMSPRRCAKTRMPLRPLHLAADLHVRLGVLRASCALLAALLRGSGTLS
jgi:hypothetical protein